jgi:hypothetical protein
MVSSSSLPRSRFTSPTPRLLLASSSHASPAHRTGPVESEIRYVPLLVEQDDRAPPLEQHVGCTQSARKGGKGRVEPGPKTRWTEFSYSSLDRISSRFSVRTRDLLLLR